MPKEIGERIEGILHLHPRGFGFVEPLKPKHTQDIFIPRFGIKGAIDGDHVVVEIFELATPEQGPEGRIVDIIERGHRILVGTITTAKKTIRAYLPLLGRERLPLVEPDPSHPLKVGDRVALEIMAWDDEKKETRARFVSFLGSIDDPSKDVDVALVAYDLSSTFPEAVLAEAEKFSQETIKEEGLHRHDLRELETVTIDPKDAKDFDDALSLSFREGKYHLGVHIADVSFFVKSHSALDEEAAKRANSTYFPNHCSPMLPPLISEELCSLKPHVDRLAVSILMTFSKEGTLEGYEIKRSVIRSLARYTYEEAKAILDGVKDSPHAAMLKNMESLCHLLKKKRLERGCVEFAIPEQVIEVDAEGRTIGLHFVPYDISHQLVEEFMLKANELVALHLSNLHIDLPYRVHEEPTNQDLNEFREQVTAFGFDLPPWEESAALQQFFEEAVSSPIGRYLVTSYIRSMQIAKYSAHNIGHYGLGLTHYTHFTSPIRRYIDLLIHRLLFDERLEREELDKKASYSSEQERISEKAEKTTRLLKKLRYLKEKAKPGTPFKALVTRVNRGGVEFEIPELLLSGFLPLKALYDEYYRYDERKKILVGSRNTIYAPGKEITVVLKQIDLIFLEVTWALEKRKR